MSTTPTEPRTTPRCVPSTVSRNRAPDWGRVLDSTVPDRVGVGTPDRGPPTTGLATSVDHVYGDRDHVDTHGFLPRSLPSLFLLRKRVFHLSTEEVRGVVSGLGSLDSLVPSTGTQVNGTPSHEISGGQVDVSVPPGLS